MKFSTRHDKNAPERSFWICLTFLVFVGFTGGASRFDVQSLLILRPLSVIACAVALLTFRKADIAGRNTMIWGLGAIFALCLLHLIPIAPALWKSLPGRQDIAQIDSLTGLGSLWRPITLTPINAWHALVSLFVPLAVLLLGLQLNREDLYRFLPALMVFGGLSGLLGIIQVIGDPAGPLYFYRFTNNGSAVGLFSNRNHAALFLAILFPVLAAWASLAIDDRAKTKVRLLTAIGIGAVLLPLIVVTGSRSGLILSLVGIASTPLIYGFKLRIDGQRQVNWLLLAVLGLAVVAIGLLGLAMLHLSRAESLERLFAQPPGSESRTDYWAICLQLFWKYFPFGSGLGSFLEAFQIGEPDSQLTPYYLNHAHNDLIEIGVTLGLPGLMIILVATIFFLRRAFVVWFRRDGRRKSVRIARMASIVILMAAAASLSDYPLRTPIMMSVFVLMSLWLIETDRKHAAGLPTGAEN